MGTSSRDRVIPTGPSSGDAGKPGDGSSRANGLPPVVRDDQPTVISAQPPLPAPQEISDSAHRILRGTILPDDRLEHFELVEYVGGGGMGRVFRAKDSRLARTVALKVLSPDQAADGETVARFRNEAQSAARLDHENIARVYHVGEDRGLHYIVFEFIEGTNIRKRVEQKGPLPLAEALSYTLQVADALAHAAARNVVHRDIKPSNLLITPEGRVKLIDMGLARLRHMGASAADLTATGVTLGTFDYISPEQARDPRNADVRSDIYSLGCTFFFMLVGRPPFPEGTVLQKLLQHQADQPPNLRQFRPDVSEEIAHILRKMLAKNPRDRYRDPGPLVRDLAAAARHAGLQPAGPGSRVWVRPKPPAVSLLQRHLPWLAPVVVLMCVFFLLNHFWSSQAIRTAPAVPSEEPAAAAGAPAIPAPPTPKIPPPEGRPTAGSAGNATVEANAKPATTKSETNGASSDLPDADPAAPPSPDTSGGPAAPAPLPGTGLRTAAPATPGGATALAGRLACRRLSSGLAAADPKPAGVSIAADLPAFASRWSKAASPPSDASRDAPVSAGDRQPAILVVDRAAKGENRFTSLAAAARAAVAGDVIELDYDGTREEKPIQLASRDVTIRAAEGRSPMILFRPSDADPVKHARTMFDVVAGGLKLGDLRIELRLPREVPADHWSLFEIRGPQSLRLERCWLTIVNASERHTAYHQDVAFFRSRPAPSADFGSEVALPNQSPAAIELSDCVVRGEAVVVEADDAQPAAFSVNNGFVASTEPVALVGGNGGMGILNEALLLDLQQVRVVARGGLCRLMDVGGPTNPPRVRVLCSDSVLVGPDGQPLIAQDGSGPIDEIRALLSWSGRRNAYEQIDVFWEIRSPDTASVVQSWGSEAWQTYWTADSEKEPAFDQVRWESPPPPLPIHAHTPADYVPLDISTETPPEANGDSSESASSTSGGPGRSPSQPQRGQRPGPGGGAGGTTPDMQGNSALRTSGGEDDAGRRASGLDGIPGGTAPQPEAGSGEMGP